MQGMTDIQSQGSSALQAYFKYWCSGLHECHRELTKELIFNFFYPKTTSLSTVWTHFHCKLKQLIFQNCSISFSERIYGPINVPGKENWEANPCEIALGIKCWKQ